MSCGSDEGFCWFVCMSSHCCLSQLWINTLDLALRLSSKKALPAGVWISIFSLGERMVFKQHLFCTLHSTKYSLQVNTRRFIFKCVCLKYI